jgi:biotin transporter BioY
MAHDVFVSYSSGDKPTADAIVATLENKGVRCWIAPRDILPSMDWGAAIVDAINASRVMVLVYSAKANDSPQIKRELERAVNRGLSVIPFRIEDVPMSTTLEYFMSMPHWLDALSPPLQGHLDRLAETTRLILQRSGATLAAPPSEQTTTSPRTPPLTTSHEVAQGIARWVTGGTESPTLAEVFVPHSDRVATMVLIAAAVIAISIMAQVRIGPIWLQPLAVLLIGASLGSRGGGLATSIYVALAILGAPVLGPGISAWTDVASGVPYVRYGLGYLAGLTAAAFAVGWLSERRSWDRHRVSAAQLALTGMALMYVSGFLWLEVTALVRREARAPEGVLPSIVMVVLTVVIVALALPRAWDAVAPMQRAAWKSKSPGLANQSTPTETTRTDLPQ